mgnify:CR=1 FL=1
MNITLKRFVAARAFSHGANSFAVGDEVPHGPTLAHVLALDCGFVVEADPKAAKATDPKE